MSFQNDKYSLTLADAQDDDALQAIYRAAHFPGKIEVAFLREPSVYSSLCAEGERTVVALMRDKTKQNAPVAMGACIIRREWINGSIRQAGYLTGLKILPEYRGTTVPISAAYQFLREATAEVDVYYTTILSENTSVIRMFEKKRKSMPAYHFLGEYTTCFFLCRPPRLTGTLVTGMDNALEQFYRDVAPTEHLTPVDIYLAGFGNGDFYSLRNKDGKVLAACALKSQQAHKQYVVKKYAGMYRLASMLPTRLVGYPSLPSPGKSANYRTFSLLRAQRGNWNALVELVRAASAQNRSDDFHMLGLHQAHPVAALFGQVRHIQYRSRLYQVQWSDQAPVTLADTLPVGMEVALL